MSPQEPLRQQTAFVVFQGWRRQQISPVERSQDKQVALFRNGFGWAKMQQQKNALI